MILDCDFCEEAEHFEDKIEAIDNDWNWIETEYEDGSTLQTIACPTHDASKVKSLDKKKRQSIDYTRNKEHSSKPKNDPAQGSLLTTIGDSE